jgi:hypothetical protein
MGFKISENTAFKVVHKQHSSVVQPSNQNFLFAQRIDLPFNEGIERNGSFRSENIKEFDMENFFKE